MKVLRAGYLALGDGALTDDAGVIEALGGRVRVVDGDEESFKITTPHDLRIAELLVAGR